MNNVVIKAEHLSKMYRLGTINNGTLWRDIQTWTALKLGREDPHSKIGQDKYSGDDDHFWALKDIDFEICQGDRVGIIGKNGAGKSTLLKLLSRVTSPSEGSIKIKGKISSLLEVGTGFNGELTGRENMYLNGAILGMKKRQIDRKLDEIIDFSGIENHIDTPVKRYSSGMYVRLAFAVAAYLDSEILIADEVLAVGDADFQKKALGKMQDLSTGQGRTVLFVSHNMSAVKSLCKTGILMEKGRIVQSGFINPIIDKYFEKNDVQTNEARPFLDLRQRYEGNEYFSLDSYCIIDVKTGCIPDSNELTKHNSYALILEGAIKKLHNNLVIFVSITNHNGDLIWVSDIFESGNIIPSDLKEGKLKLEMRLPLELLPSAFYSVSVSSVVHCVKWEILADSSKIGFSYLNTGISYPVYESNNHPFTGNQNPSLLAYSTPTKIISN